MEIYGQANFIMDPITGLLTRESFIDQAQQIVEQMQRDEHEVAVVYMDIQGFKIVNQEFGFRAGDQLLRKFGQILKTVFPDRIISRFDNDHFVVFEFASRVEAKLNEVERLAQDLEDGHSVSEGIYVYDYTKTNDFEEACDRASLACEAVCVGEVVGNRCYFNARMEEKQTRMKYIRCHIQQALKHHVIHVYYQPVIRSATVKTCSVEALARWTDEKIGVISPGEFIPVLEDSHLSYLLDLYVVEWVLRDQRKRLDAGLEVIPASVNLSQVDFGQVDMVEEINRLTGQYGIDRKLLIIEITESACTVNPKLLEEVLGKFHESGYQVWMDDFGSGYSSLNVLRQFPFDLLKFDLQFLRDFSENGRGAIVLKNMIQMARELGIHTLAEGVETMEQFRFLKTNGCERLQGYFFGKPCAYDDLIELIRDKVEPYQSAPYYDAIGSIPDRDSDMPRDLQKALKHLPKAVLEMRGNDLAYVRSNEEYVEFLLNSGMIQIAPEDAAKVMNWKMPIPEDMREVVEKSRRNGQWIYVVERSFGVEHRGWLRVIAEDAVTGAVAFRLIMES